CRASPPAPSGARSPHTISTRVSASARAAASDSSLRSCAARSIPPRASGGWTGRGGSGCAVIETSLDGRGAGMPARDRPTLRGMARSPLTLAAAATSALPRVRVVAAGPLTAGGTGRCDAAVLRLDDGRSVVVRAPVDDAAARELAAEAEALRALTAGVRGLLGARAPELLGEARLGDRAA